MIRAWDLRCRYPGQTQDALAGLNLDALAGEISLISGPTGCGKSTFGLALCGAIPNLIPGKLSGGLSVFGVVPKSQQVSQLSRNLGFLLQNVEFMTFTDRVEEEIAFGLENYGVNPSRMKGLIRRALESVHATHLRNRALSTLSTGERQRVLLASLLALDQRVLVLDEPLAFLDRKAQLNLLSVLSALSQSGKAVLIFEHRRDIVSTVASQEFYIQQGRQVPAPLSSPEFTPLTNGCPGAPVLIMDNVSFSWPGQKKPVFSEVSFDVRAGESVALLGENGSGKTTLFRLAMGLLHFKSGAIEICGMVPGKASPSKIGEKAGFIFQQPDHQLYLTTVQDEVGAWAAYPGSAQEELERLDLTDLASRHPKSLSMGQKRRVTIAAACARSPKILLLDEPSVGQDDRSLALVLARLSQYVQDGGAVIASTHDARVAKALGGRAIKL